MKCRHKRLHYIEEEVFRNEKGDEFIVGRSPGIIPSSPFEWPIGPIKRLKTYSYEDLSIGDKRMSEGKDIINKIKCDCKEIDE